AGREQAEARLLTRKGNDISAAFPELARALAALPFEGFILDAELVVPDEAGRPSFQRLQNRVRVSRGLEVRRGAVETPAVLYVFDLLAFEGYDLRPLSLEQRKALLEQIVPRVGPLKYLSHFEKDGEALYEQVVKMGLEGIVAKKADAPYRAGRSPNWLKTRADRGSPVQGMDGRGAVAAAGVCAVPGRQTGHGDREAGCGRRDARCGAAGGDRASRIPHLASRDQVFEPRQSLLARRGLHQGRLDRILPRHIPVDAALSGRSAAGAHALSRRHQREVLFPEGRPGVCPGVRAHGHDLERGLATRSEE